VPHIQNDPEFRGIAGCWVRFQIAQIYRPKGRKLYMMMFCRGRAFG